jgi:hypothetical protein
MVEGCGEVSHTSTSIVSFEAALEYLDMTGAVVDSDGTPQTLSLCSLHYQYLYRQVHYPEPCTACSSQPRYGGEYVRRCPDPVRVTEFLKETLDYRNELTATSKICKPRYIFHRQVLQQMHDSNSTETEKLESATT